MMLLLSFSVSGRWGRLTAILIWLCFKLRRGWKRLGRRSREWWMMFIHTVLQSIHQAASCKESIYSITPYRSPASLSTSQSDSRFSEELTEVQPDILSAVESP